jgi:hypothetical protein
VSSGSTYDPKFSLLLDSIDRKRPLLLTVNAIDCDDDPLLDAAVMALGVTASVLGVPPPIVGYVDQLIRELDSKLNTVHCSGEEVIEASGNTDHAGRITQVFDLENEWPLQQRFMLPKPVVKPPKGFGRCEADAYRVYVKVTTKRR